MSNFTRKITDFSALKNSLENNSFMQKIDEELIRKGQAFLAFRNNETTVYYNGNQLFNSTEKNSYSPSVYNHYLPLMRSQTLRNECRKETFLEDAWLKETKLNNSSFLSIYDEILDNIEKEESPESLQASRFYQFSPLNENLDHEIVLLDVEAAFAESKQPNEQNQTNKQPTDRIDLVFYHTVKRQLMFIEVKRLSDDRLKEKSNAPAEVIAQLTRYSERCKKETAIISKEYNNVIEYYNKLSKKNMPLINEDSRPLLGLLLVEFTRSTKDKNAKKDVEEILKTNNFKWYAIGNTSNVTSSTLTAIYNAIK